MKISILSIAITSVLLVGCKTTQKTNVNDLAIKMPINSTVDLSKSANDKVPVIINPGRFTTEKVVYRLPKVVPGTYAVSDFGKYIEAFKAFDYKGNEIAVTRLDNNAWEITNGVELDKISYLVNDTFDMEIEGGIGKEVPFSPSGTNIEDSNFVLNLHGFIGYFDSLKNNQYKVDVVSPFDFAKTSALQEVASSTSKDGKVITTSYFANRYFDISDNPMFYGALEVEEFQVDDIKIVLSVYSPNKIHSASKLKDVMYTMMKAQKKFLGDINSTSRYDIYLYLSDQSEKAAKGFGALEHHTSTVVVLPESMSEEGLAETMIDVVSHEFFHIVTPLSVHSEDIHYFDYENPTFSKHLWMYEGITEYFATFFQVNQELVSEEEFYTDIMTKIQGASKMNDTMSFTKMSENVLHEPYKSEYLNVYQKGALIGMCIDIIMREESNRERGILSLMKELSNKYGKDKPFEDDKLIDEITEMTYPKVGNFLKTYVEGTTAIDYNDFFKKVGLVIKEGKVETNYIQNNGELILAGDPITRSIRFTDLVNDNSFWKDNGAQFGDALKEVNGKLFTMENGNEILQEMYMWKPGTEIEVKLNRNGEEIIIKKVLTQSYTTGQKLSENENATKEQLELRKAWLKG